ncbi:unnamed protein product [Pedinophyceae sp. YPF-701]|nr:unnamed protein product [Pedinophyceae sp. YPF-701]
MGNACLKGAQGPQDDREHREGSLEFTTTLVPAPTPAAPSPLPAPAAPTPPPAPPPAPAEPLAEGLKWQRGELLGSGAFGQVYLGMNMETGELMAVKHLPVGGSAGRPGDRDEVDRHVKELEEEVGILRALRHPNIVRYLGTERNNKNLSIFLEFVPGGSIASLLARFGPFQESVVRVYTRQILLGLEYLHQHRHMHRDIKGANILVDNAGTIKLADFGASRKIESLVTMGDGYRSIKGTPYWMAPEVIKQEGHGRAADIWSVGCTVIEMASARPPWSDHAWGNQMAAMFHIANCNRPPTAPAHLSEEAKDFLALCFERRPKMRPNATRLLRHPFVATAYPRQSPTRGFLGAGAMPSPVPEESGLQQTTGADSGTLSGSGADSGTTPSSGVAGPPPAHAAPEPAAAHPPLESFNPCESLGTPPPMFSPAMLEGTFDATTSLQPPAAHEDGSVAWAVIPGGMGMGTIDGAEEPCGVPATPSAHMPRIPEGFEVATDAPQRRALEPASALAPGLAATRPPVGDSFDLGYNPVDVEPDVASSSGVPAVLGSLGSAAGRYGGGEDDGGHEAVAGTPLRHAPSTGSPTRAASRSPAADEMSLLSFVQQRSQQQHEMIRRSFKSSVFRLAALPPETPRFPHGAPAPAEAAPREGGDESSTPQQGLDAAGDKENAPPAPSPSGPAGAPGPRGRPGRPPRPAARVRRRRSRRCRRSRGARRRSRAAWGRRRGGRRGAGTRGCGRRRRPLRHSTGGARTGARCRAPACAARRRCGPRMGPHRWWRAARCPCRRCRWGLCERGLRRLGRGRRARRRRERRRSPAWTSSRAS